MLGSESQLQLNPESSRNTTYVLRNRPMVFCILESIILGLEYNARSAAATRLAEVEDSQAERKYHAILTHRE